MRISNYRKTGELFVQLLTMRPIHDSNDVYRYCVGVAHLPGQASPTPG